MTDEQPPQKEKGPWEGLTVQGFGCAVGTLWVLHQKSNDVYYEAGYELALGGVITGVLYMIYFLFGPRIKRWRNRR